MKPLLTAALCLCLLSAGCSDWERTTFQTLSASKVVIDNAAAAYEARTIPHNACDKDLIEKARAADAIAVNAMGVYEVVKHTSGATEQAIAGVDQAIADLAPVLVSIKTLSTRPCEAKSLVQPTPAVSPFGGFTSGGVN